MIDNHTRDTNQIDDQNGENLRDKINPVFERNIFQIDESQIKGKLYECITRDDELVAICDDEHIEYLFEAVNNYEALKRQNKRLAEALWQLMDDLSHGSMVFPNFGVCEDVWNQAEQALNKTEKF